MCKLCDQAALRGQPRHLHGDPVPQPAAGGALSRRHFLGAGVGAAVLLAGVGGAATAAPRAPAPTAVGERGRRTLIRGGAVLSMDPAVGNFGRGDVLLEGARIVAVGVDLAASGAAVIDAAGMIVLPGFIDTHHHHFETALRSYLADAVLMPDGRPGSEYNYYETVLKKFAPAYRPEDVYISDLFGSLSQLDAGITSVLDVSQIHHSPEHSDAAVEGLRDSGRRAVFGYFEGQGPRSRHPGDAQRLRSRWFASDDQLTSMAMGAEIYLPGHEQAWRVGRELNLPLALHVVASFGMRDTFDQLAAAGQFGPDNIFIHMAGMSDLAWRRVADSGAHVSLAVPIEMQMRHGSPPIQQALDLGLQPSLSSDVECTMAADMFTQMRSALTLQRMFANEKALNGQDYPRLLTAHDVIRFATIEGAKALKLDHKAGSLTPGKQADIVLLDATAINTTPLNHVPGAVVTLMDRSNVSTVLVAGKLRKWRGQLLGVDLRQLSRRLDASRDYLFRTAAMERNLFR